MQTKQETTIKCSIQNRGIDVLLEELFERYYAPTTLLLKRTTPEGKKTSGFTRTLCLVLNSDVKKQTLSATVL